jgi:tetratricopeptide (TPR) repeat protein
VLPPPVGRLPEHVRGRDAVLATLRRLARRPDGRVQVLAGLGGAGKTTVALAAAAWALDHGRHVWWVPAGDGPAMLSALTELARELGGTVGEVDDAFAGRRHAPDLLWRLLESHRDWVLVFDNADDPDTLAYRGAAAADGTAWIRPTRSGLVVVTTRMRDAQFWGRTAVVHHIGPLARSDSVRVLRDLAPDAGGDGEARALSARLGDLALALTSAGRYLHADFVCERTFEAYRRAIDDRLPELLGRGTEERTVVTETWELSLDNLADRGYPGARPLLRLLSSFAAQVPVPRRLLADEPLAELCRGADVSDLLSALSAFGLVEPSTGPDPVGGNGVTVHPLLAELNRRQLSPAEATQIGEVQLRLLRGAVDGLLRDRPDDWPVWARLAPHVRAVLDYSAVYLGDHDLRSLVRLASSTSWALARAGVYAPSEELARMALDRAAARPDADPRTVAIARDALAASLHRRGELAEAAAQYALARSEHTRCLDADHPEVLRIRNEMARILADQGRYEAAAQEFREVLDARTRVLGAEHASTVTSRHGLAYALAELGDLDGAEREFVDVLRVRLRELGAAHPSTMTTKHEIARVHLRQGRLDTAEREFGDVLADRVSALGQDHPHTLATQYELAMARLVRGADRAARRGLDDVLRVRVRVLGEAHPVTLITRREVVLLGARRRGRRARAELRRIAGLLASALGPDHPETRATLRLVER